MMRNFPPSKIACNIASSMRRSGYEDRGFRAYHRTAVQLSKRSRNELRHAGESAECLPAVDQRLALRARAGKNQSGQDQRIWAIGGRAVYHHQAGEAEELVEPTC